MYTADANIMQYVPYWIWNNWNAGVFLLTKNMHAVLAFAN